MAKIFVEAYGCSASFADSEMISGLILNGGHTLVDNSSESDLNIIVTCSVKDATANKTIGRIKSPNPKPLAIEGGFPKAEKSTVDNSGTITMKKAESAGIYGKSGSKVTNNLKIEIKFKNSRSK